MLTPIIVIAIATGAVAAGLGMVMALVNTLLMRPEFAIAAG
jgi:hypothetical protein